MLSRQSAIKFVSDLLTHVRAQGVSTHGWIIDHICFRTAEKAEYESLKDLLTQEVSHDFAGTLLSDASVNGRPIATIRMKEPLIVDSFNIEAIEIPSPKSGSQYASGFEHIEVVTTKSFMELKELFRGFTVEDATHKPINPELIIVLPSGRIKFHQLPLSCLIEVENDAILYEWMTRTSLLTKLLPWQPLLSGSLPIGVHLEKSDLDILLCATAPNLAMYEINESLKDIGFVSWKKRSGSSEQYVGRLQAGPRDIELFLCDQSPVNQNAHRHLLTEYLYLVKGGESLRSKVRSLKIAGASTEEAFAKALGIFGDAYQALLYDS